jgi:hypothetical protein
VNKTKDQAKTMPGLRVVGGAPSGFRTPDPLTLKRDLPVDIRSSRHVTNSVGVQRNTALRALHAVTPNDGT